MTVLLQHRLGQPLMGTTPAPGVLFLGDGSSGG
jgi:hypothetical protein